MFTPPNEEENTARSICDMLSYHNEEHPEFFVHDVSYIPAQVKVVKCIVQDIAVDISFNQVAGLSSLCFLEKADEYIGRDHLFKFSIILIKAWCFYESRILGAQHGLIATYALAILVLYIINHFHSSLDSPLAVLDKFLEYYSTFDWEHHCISLNGPVYKKSLPKIVAVTPESSRKDLLLKEDFFENYIKLFSVQSDFKTRGGVFPVKHLNIIDPLKGSNNLGRSIRKDKSFRISSALAYGCAELKRILKLPTRDIDDQMKMFFFNTVQWNQRVQRLETENCIMKGDFCRSFSDLICGHLYYQRSGCNFIDPSYPISNFLSVLDQHLSRKLVQTFSEAEILDMFCSVMDVDQIEYFRRTCKNEHFSNVEDESAQREGQENMTSNASGSNTCSPDLNVSSGSCFDLSEKNFPRFPIRKDWKPLPGVKIKSAASPASFLAASLVEMKKADGAPAAEESTMLFPSYKLQDEDDFPLLRR